MLLAMLRAVVLMSTAVAMASSFQVLPQTRVRPVTATSLRDATENQGETETAEEKAKLETFMAKKFPAFHSLLLKDDSIYKGLKSSSNGYTFFAPNAQAFEDLGEKKRVQLEDPRNLETAQKMANYHVISTEAVDEVRLRTEDWRQGRPKDGSPPPLTVRGVVTLGGEIPIGRSKSGGFLGLGAKEDGGVVVGPDAKILQTFKVGDCIVHEVDALVSPVVLWRYCDQLRIPGF
jgi:uncharacterized surface protein with fasciclin (FAS1) repeats